MRFLVFMAVVERIAKYPFGCVVWRAVGLHRKAFLTVRNGCNITWGYVSSMGQGRGRGRNPVGVRGCEA